MPRNGNGTYTPPVGSFSPAVNGQQAQAADFNALLADLSSGLTTSIASDGQTTITDDLPMSGYKHLDVDDATLRDQYTALGQYMDGSMLYGTVGGTADAIELTFNPPFPALVEGMCVSWKNTNGPNTADVTLKIDSNTAKDIKKNVSEALISGDLPDNSIVVARYDGTNFQVSSTATTGFTQFIEASIASATTTDLGSLAGNTALVTGTTTITSFGSSASLVRPIFFVRFNGVLTLTHNGTSLILPTSANITTAAGDSLIAEYLGSGNWKVLSYSPISGIPLVQPKNPTIQYLLSGTSATYTTPAGCTKLIVKEKGGGGEGGSYSTGNGANGGATSFNSIVANGGSGGEGGASFTTGSGGAGGTGGSGSASLRIPGQGGSSAYYLGGQGGGQGGGKSPTSSGTVVAGAANSGGGGSGQGSGGNGFPGGGGGGEGEYAEFTITSPSATYTYTVGAGGTGGSGGDGGSGRIIVEEYYGTN